MTKKNLQPGTLYQVKFRHDWIVAEYKQRVEPRIVKGYRSSDGATEWHEPLTHYWYGVTEGAFHLYDKHLEVRECSAELLSQIQRIQVEREQLKQQQNALWRELRELCGTSLADRRKA